MELTEKRIQIHQSLTDDKGRSLGEEAKILAMRKAALVVLNVKTMHTVTDVEFPVDTIKEVNVFMEADASNKSVIGRAIVGGVLTGGIGAIVGGLSGSGKKDAWYVEIVTKSDTAYVYRLHKETDRTILIKWCNKHGL